MKQIKGLLKSKVFWFNLITIALEITNALATMLPSATFLLINAVGNIILRFLTEKPLSEK
jgi:hypothetical protein